MKNKYFPISSSVSYEILEPCTTIPLILLRGYGILTTFVAYLSFNMIQIVATLLFLFKSSLWISS